MDLKAREALAALMDTPPWDWPEGTGTMLLDILRDHGTPEADLLLAIESAGDLIVINDDLVGALLSILNGGQKSEKARSQAAISFGPVLEQVDIGGSDDPDGSPITERTFQTIQQTLRTLYADAAVPEEVRRRVLEASVRAIQEWHFEAVSAAWASGDEAWRLTAAFCMRFVRGFEKQILEALESPNQDIRYEAVLAAGNWDLALAWPYVAPLLKSSGTEKYLLIAAIEASSGMCPDEAIPILLNLVESDDEDVAEAAHAALAMAEGASAAEDDVLDDDDEEDW
jgi:hypothetical protein